jgi:hypothetical protein
LSVPEGANVAYALPLVGDADEITLGAHRADGAVGRRRAPRQRKAGLTMKRGTKRVRAEEGSGNVFADLGLPHAEQELLKAR